MYNVIWPCPEPTVVFVYHKESRIDMKNLDDRGVCQSRDKNCRGSWKCSSSAKNNSISGVSDGGVFSIENSDG